jgi:hypothetical protein
MYAGGVNEYNLRSGQFARRARPAGWNLKNACDAITRGLGLAGDNGDFLAHKRIQQSALAGVRPAKDGYES